MFVYDGKETFNIFSWNGGELYIPAEGYTFVNPPKGCRYDGKTLNIEAEAGKVLTLTVEEV